ncbi:hypothetical protein K439DRAFT_261079 [Ramaria rubella]|nr:hypothetical protein K439DRAFT_261079 [Ramaria rubella]
MARSFFRGLANIMSQAVHKVPELSLKIGRLLTHSTIERKRNRVVSRHIQSHQSPKFPFQTRESHR